MKFCPKCGAQLDDAAIFCPACGTNFQSGAQSNQYDHTAEFDAKDVSDNKPYAMLVYLMGIIGIFIALLAARDSKYLQFHIRQVIKFQVTQVLVGIVMAVLFFTIIIPIAGAIFLGVLFVIQIICFFRICSGKSVEPEIIRSFKFMK